ncbi:ribosome-associated factor Y [bacterium BMS3Abin05]|nr:ribosome-associated factor Y [bacterium BMS3Abin05]GBE26958.1 ribosome-associated factor Y [bacterium BMS3Bbin03]HDK36208.1 ribosome-associated translation inhibitor RaiA [Bacteroidota bacterium]HDZ13124.1 ribosome-associated translation inhibitor RaiA [Bacteroidota bacterium]
MRISVTARHFKASDQLRSYGENEVKRLKKFFDGIVDCEVVLTQERANRIANISISVNSHKFVAAESSENFYKSIDLAVVNMERQLKRFKEKLRTKSHRAKEQEVVSSEVEENEFNEES